MSLAPISGVTPGVIPDVIPGVIVARAAREAAPWVAGLQAQGIAAQALAPMALWPVADAGLRAALAQARSRWRDYAAVMFVSPNAVHFFFEQNRGEMLAEQAPLAINFDGCKVPRIWAPGPGTVAALRHWGVADAAIDAPRAQAQQFDSEALWPLVAGQIRPGSRLLLVRGGSSAAQAGGAGRNWLAQQVLAAGGSIDFVVAYERRAACLDAAQLALVQRAASDGTLWLLSSAEALAYLCASAGAQSWAQARALATHPRIAAAAEAAGFAQVRHCRPSLDDIVASIKSWTP